MSKTKIQFKIEPLNFLAEQELLKHIEYLQSKKQLQQFASFLSDEVLMLHEASHQMQLYRHFVSVLLCIEVNGLDKLVDRNINSEGNQLYTMGVHLNAYVGSIIEVLRLFGGDVLSLFSNLFVTMWKCLPDESMHEILHTVIVCANVLQRQLGYYQATSQVSLYLKTVISCGNMSYGVFGSNVYRQAVFIGDAFQPLRNLIDLVNCNEITVSEKSYPHLLQNNYNFAQANGYVTITKISYSSREAAKKAFFDEKYLQVVKLIGQHYHQRDALLGLLSANKLLSHVKVHSLFVKSLPPRKAVLRAAREWTISEMQPLQNELIYEHLTDSHSGEYISEMKEATCLYMRISTGLLESNALLPVINDVFKILIDELTKSLFIVDHVYVHKEDIMVRILFGLVMNRRENEAAQALKLGRNLKNLFEKKRNVNVSGGVSSGIAFCCVIGHPLRKEYAIIGHPLEKARRLSTLTQTKIVCDLKVFYNAKLSSLYFILLKTEQDANGEVDSLMEFNESLDHTMTVVPEELFIDRISDVNLGIAVIQDPKTIGASSICFNADLQLGKTTLLNHLNEKCALEDCTTVYITLNEMASVPYYTVTEIYRIVFDKMYTIDANMDLVCDLPRALVSFVGEILENEDIALTKYRTFNIFRDLLSCVPNKLVIFVDNVHLMDQRSWEIFELIFPSLEIKLLMTSRTITSNMKKCMATMKTKVKDLLPLKDRYIGPLICNFLKTEGVSYKLVNLLATICKGDPGHIECLLLKMMDNSTVYIRFSSKENIDTSTHFYKDFEMVSNMNHMFTIADFSPTNAVECGRLSMKDIYRNHFDSMSSFMQLVLKTAAVIGMQFGRQILRLALNLPSESDMANVIQFCFEEKIFQCASAILHQKYRLTYDIIYCRCCFDKPFTKKELRYPKYAYCKLMQFKNQLFQEIAYSRLPENQRHELHILCAEFLEKSKHICPSCMKNPANYYAFLGTYEQFLEYCNDTSTAADYYQQAKDCYEQIKTAIGANMNCLPSDSEPEVSMNGDFVPDDPQDKLNEPQQSDVVIDDKYIQMARPYDASACHCIPMLHRVYNDLIRHSTLGNERGKAIFYMLKFGLVQMCMRDIEGAMVTLNQTRELTSVNSGLKECQFTPVFRKYHIGKASLALALCNLKIKNISAAKCNIMIALRQYNVPIIAFSFKRLRFLLKRKHLKRRTIKPYMKKNDPLGWDLGCALFICSKIYSLENEWKIAADCCNFGMRVMRVNNSNVCIIFDSYWDIMQILSLSGDQYNCQRLQTYMIQEFQNRFAQNDVFYFHMLLDMLGIIMEIYLANCQLKKSIAIGYRFVYITNNSKVMKITPYPLLLLCELLMYSLKFQNFNDIISLLYRSLSTYHKSQLLYYYLMCLHYYIFTGFHVQPFENIYKFAQEYFSFTPHCLTFAEKAFKTLIQIHLLRSNRYTSSLQWEVPVEYQKAVKSSCKVMKLMLFQLESCILKWIWCMRYHEGLLEVAWGKQIKLLRKHLKEAVQQNRMYEPAYFGLNAWYFMAKNKKRKAKKLLKRMEKATESGINLYHKALAMRVKNHWEGGFLLDYERRPKVGLHEAIGYEFLEVAQFLHSYVLP